MRWERWSSVIFVMVGEEGFVTTIGRVIYNELVGNDTWRLTLTLMLTVMMD
jgi:hypothetical protein